MRTYRLVAVDNESVSPLEVQASCERVAVGRLIRMLVQWHCHTTGLPYYACHAHLATGTRSRPWVLMDRRGSIPAGCWQGIVAAQPDGAWRHY